MWSRLVIAQPGNVTSSRLASGLTQLRDNSVYRVSDVVQHLGSDWTSLCIHLLWNPLYRHSVLHEWLLRTTRDESGRTLHHLELAGAQHAWYRSAGPWVCSRRSKSCTLGALVENSSVTVPAPRGSSHDVSILFGAYNRSEPAAQPELRYEHDWCAKVVELAMTLQSRLDRGRCRAAPPGTAAVHLRLGDKPDIYMHVVTDRGKDKSYGPRVPIYQQAAALGCAPNVTTVAIVGVLQYAEQNLWQGTAQDLIFHRSFGHSNRTQVAAERYVRELRATLDACGTPHYVRSSADVDDDMCFLVTAEYYVPSVGGISKLMVTLRRILTGMRQARQRGEFNKAALADDRGAIGAYGAAACSWAMRSPEPPTSVPREGTCARRQAECAAKAERKPVGQLWDASTLQLQYMQPRKAPFRLPAVYQGRSTNGR